MHRCNLDQVFDIYPLPPPLALDTPHQPSSLSCSLHLALLHLLHAQFHQHRPELFPLPPIAPDTLQTFGASPASRTGYTTVQFLPFGLFVRVCFGEEFELEAVAFMFEDLFVNRMGD